MKYYHFLTRSLSPKYSLVLAALWLLSAAALFAETFDLVSEGRPVAEIVIPSDEEIAKIPLWLLGTQLAEGAENRLKPATMDPISRAGVRPAVKFFNAALEECVGTALPVVSERTPGSRAIVFEVEPAKLMDDDTFSIEFPDDDTLLIRGSGRSVHWALNHILHEHAGVRWLFLNHTHYPKSDHLSVPRSEVRQSPSYKFERKEGYYRERMMDYHQSMNLKPRPIPRDSHCAMIDFAFPVTKYAHDQSWPVEIMPVRNGKKLVLPLAAPDRPARNQEVFLSRWQPCFSNPKTAEIAIENILEILDQDPLRQRIDLGIMDKGGECECEDCLAIVPGRLNQIGFPDYSEVYYAWVNKVVEGVTQKYPDVYFPLIAYRETWTAPSFKVHPKVIPFIAIDSHQFMDADVAENKWKNIKDWSEKASQLGTSEYLSGIDSYALPRIFFNLQSDFYKKLHQLGGVGNRAQAWDREGSEGEGPKNYLRARLLWDINADPQELVDEWYRLTVGEAAAPYLREYFQFWEDYATGDRIRRTDWFKNHKSRICFRLMDWESNRSQSYTFALDKGDMAKLRKLMEQVVAKTETPEQAARAARLMLAFEYYECNAYALFSEIMPPEGVLPDPAAAVELIEAVPEAYAYASKRQSVEDAISTQSLFARGGTFDIHETMADIFARISPHMDDPKVQAALERLRVDESIPSADRERLLARAAKAHSLVTTPVSSIP